MEVNSEYFNYKDAINGNGTISIEALLTQKWNRPTSRYAVGCGKELNLNDFDLKKFKEENPNCIYITDARSIILEDEEEYNEKKLPVNEGIQNLFEDSPAMEDFSLINGKVSSNGITLFYKDTIVEVGKHAINAFYVGDCDEIKKLVLDLVEKIGYKKAVAEERNIDLIGYAEGTFYSTTEKINAVDVNIEKQYNDDFPSAFNKIVDFLDIDNRQSGIVLLRGIPGSGKTTFIRHLINKYPNNYVLITPSIAAHLAEPDFISYLLDNRDSVFILEDCEQVIMNRENSSFGSSVASLLNMSDGLMSDIFNGKFICTFNTDLENVDDALLRKGRCIVDYEFKALSEDKTRNLMKELYDLSEDKIQSISAMTLADIYNYDEEEDEINKAESSHVIGF